MSLGNIDCDVMVLSGTCLKVWWKLLSVNDVTSSRRCWSYTCSTTITWSCKSAFQLPILDIITEVVCFIGKFKLAPHLQTHLRTSVTFYPYSLMMSVIVAMLPKSKPHYTFRRNYKHFNEHALFLLQDFYNNELDLDSEMSDVNFVWNYF